MSRAAARTGRLNKEQHYKSINGRMIGTDRKLDQPHATKNKDIQKAMLIGKQENPQIVVVFVRKFI